MAPDEQASGAAAAGNSAGKGQSMSPSKGEPAPPAPSEESKSTEKSKGPAKGKPALPALSGKGKGSLKGTGKSALPKKNWAAIPQVTTLKNDNAEILARFREAECYTSAEVLGDTCIDWNMVEDVAVIKGSLEIDEATTGIVLVQVAGKLVGFRNICDGRGANPIREYFALVLNQLLNERSGTENMQMRLAQYRAAHLFVNGDEFERIRNGLRTCIQSKTGLKGLVNEAEEDSLDWLKENPGFGDFSHDLIRVLTGFFPMSKKSAFGRRNQVKCAGLYDEAITAESVSRSDRSKYYTFTGVMEVVKGLSIMQDKMTLSDEVQINLAMGLAKEDPNYIRRTHNNPLYNNSSGSIRAKMLCSMGKLTAFDALVNNWDRMSVSLLWDNKGNLTNVVVEKDTLEVVGIDQFVNPIDVGAGLDTYRKRLGVLVQSVCAMSKDSFEDADLEALDASKTSATITQDIVDFETMLEARSQASIMGKAVMEKQQELSPETHKHKWLQDLQKKFINATGVYFELRFLAKHFVRGLMDGFQAIVLQPEQRSVILSQIADIVVEAFDRTSNEQLDLWGNIQKCSEFVDGNIAVIESFCQA